MAATTTNVVLFFLFLLLLLTTAAPASAPTTLPSGDLKQLISFKRSLPNPDLLSSWQPGGNPCASFSGVTCRASRVVSVRLNSLPLNADFGSVSSSLLAIDSLETLSLTSTNLSGSLSPAIGAFCGGRLVELNLAGNRLASAVTEIASLASVCSGLRTLNLSGNALGSSSSSVAGIRMGLEVLDLSFNKISGADALQWLLLSGPDLQYLNLSDNAISGGIEAVGNCSALRRLDLSRNGFSSIALGAFATCENLSYLNISSNHFYGDVPADLFGTCGSLLRLDLSNNNFSGTVPANFSSCSILESVNLSNNNFSGEFPIEIFTAMASLKRLELSFNGFTGKLPETLAKLPNLVVLDLSSNSLTGWIPPGLCSSTASGLNLKELYLQNNNFTGPIPASVSNCSMLVSLDLSFNYLTGAIPSTVGSLSRLRDLIMWQNLLSGEIPPEFRYANALENLILDNNDLTGPIPSGLSNCTNLNWISLSSNRISGGIPPWIGRLSNLAILKIGNNSLSGAIPPEIGDCKSLIWLDLNSNQLNGTIPLTLAKQSGKIAVGLVTGKRYVYLRNDGSSECRGAGNLLEFAGIRPEQLNRVPTRRSCHFTRIYKGNTQYTFNNNGSMLFLDLSYNNLQGGIPAELGSMYYVMVLNLAHNALSGVIPADLGKLKSIGILDLSHNALEGPIPASFAGLSMLSEIDLSNNNLNGTIPDVGQLATFPAVRYTNNSGLCGFPLPPCGGGGNSTITSAETQRQRAHRRQASLAGSVAMGLLFSLFCIFGVTIILMETKKRQRRKEKMMSKENGNNSGYFGGSRSHSGGGFAIGGQSSWKLTSTREALSITLSAFEKPLRKLTFADLLEATNGFHNDSLVGSGGFGDVYKAQLKDDSVVAIKKLIHVSGQGDREFTAEMETIGKIKHRNLVPLLGFCKVGEERLLVYEYMKYGSLEDVLHNRKKTGIKLDWATRRKIAEGAARGLAFLHHNCLPHIIHRDMKSSNVLLDDNLEARVSDFGMARLVSAMDTHLSVSTLAGTPGYVPPEYYQSFRCSTKGDVYSYGVVLLELLTGRQPTDSADFGEDSNLVGWVKQQTKLRRISDVFDPVLLRDGEDPNLELELLQHLRIACSCLDDRPMRRPTMLKVMAMFKEIQAGGSTVDSTDSVAVSVDGSGSYGAEVEMSLKEEAKEEV